MLWTIVKLGEAHFEARGERERGELLDREEDCVVQVEIEMQQELQ